MLGHCTYYTPRSKVDDPRKILSEIENYLSTPNHAGACTRLPFGAYDSRREDAETICRSHHLFLLFAVDRSLRHTNRFGCSRHCSSLKGLLARRKTKR
jgi:hypothetical protein